MLVYLYNPQPLQRTLYMVRCSLQPRRHQRHSGNIKNTHYWQYVTHNVQRRRPRRAREQRCRRVVFVRQCLRFPETSCNRRQWHAWSPWDDQSVPCTHCWQTDRQTAAAAARDDDAVKLGNSRDYKASALFHVTRRRANNLKLNRQSRAFSVKCTVMNPSMDFCLPSS